MMGSGRKQTLKEPKEQKKAAEGEGMARKTVEETGFSPEASSQVHFHQKDIKWKESRSPSIIDSAVP